MLAAILAIQLPQVQTYVSHKVLSSIEGKIDGIIEFEKIHVKPFNALIIKNAAIIDKNPLIEGADTLFKAEYISARFSLRGIFRKEGLHIGRAYVTNAVMTLVEEDYRVVNLTRIFRIPFPDPDRPVNEDPVFSIRRASVYNMTFRLKNARPHEDTYSGYGINWNDLEINDLNVEARRMHLAGRVMTGSVDYASFTEKSGYVCKSLSGKARVGRGLSLIEEIRLSDPWSELYLPKYSMTYEDPLDFQDYIGKIVMDGVMENISLDFRTLAFFVPEMKGINMKTDLSGHVSGRVNDLVFKNMRISTADSLSIRFNGRIKGLPDIGKARMSLELRQLRGTTSCIGNALKAFVPEMQFDPGKFAKGETVCLYGKASGTLNSLNADITAGLGYGYARTRLKIENLLSGNRSTAIGGDVVTHNFDIGKVLDSKLLGECSIRTSFDADIGNRDGETAVRIDSLFIDRLRFNDYDYSRIAAAGTMKKHAFDGRIVSYDPNLNFMFQGVFSLSPRTRNSIYRFYANLGYADLNALNIDKRGISKISFEANANFNRRRAGDIIGSMELVDIVLTNGSGRHDIGKVEMNSYFGDELYRMRMRSSFADASYAGTAQITEFFSALKNVTLKRELPALFRDTVTVAHNDRYRISFRSKNSMDLLAFAAPGMYISDSTELSISIDTAGIFRTEMKSPRIAFNENYIKDMEMSVDNVGGGLGGEITGKTINVGTVALENNSFKLFARNDFIGFGYRYENPGNLVNRGEIFITGRLARNEDGRIDYKVEMLPSRLLLNSREWNINHSVFDIKGSDIDIGKVEFTSGDQAIRMSGGLSATGQDTLSLRLERFDISIVNPLLKNKFGIEGAATGEIGVTSPKLSRGIILDFLVDSTKLAGADVGTLRFKSSWDEKARSLDVALSNEIAGTRTFGITGNYSPQRKGIDMYADLDRADISYAGPFLKSVFSDVSGHISGKFHASGTLDDLHLTSSDSRIEDSELRIAYTNVPYSVSGGFSLDDSGVHFDDIAISDRNGNRGSIAGGIRYDRLKNMEMDTRISVTDMECMNLSEGQNSSFYGNLAATGNISIYGPFDALKMDINARTSGSGQLHIPIPATATAVTGNLLTFKEIQKEEYIDPYELMIRKISTEKKTSGDLSLRLNVQAAPEVEAFVEIDKASGNVLRGRGTGNIELELQGEDFNILGDYTLNSGNYRFVAQGLAYRDFSISDGSSIKFNGDIMESDLDITATYRTKTSLATLIADTSSVSTRRTVDCGISISDKIKNPRLSFSIDIPDIDPAIKSRVESALSTEDKIQKQFLALIVFNSFLPDDQSGIVNNASMLYSTVTGIMYNQLNNIFQKLDIPLDLGLNYQPNERGQDVFDVAISTQLFNNRVVVNGNIGNQRYSSGNSNSDVVGDLDIEIKLDRPGLFRLNIFSHSADQYTNYLDDSQRNGIGIAYQQEFNSFREFFRNIFTRKKKRQEENAEAVHEGGGERKTIVIGPERE